jgi:threonylcarbamoyladenosine tRNA methylthiotransferase MtaB
MKIYLDSIGCRLNQSEIEQFSRDFRRAGHQLTGTPEEADIAVINTCAVTAKASSDSRSKTRRIGKRVREGVVLTGCWSTLEPEKASSIPNVKDVIPNNQKMDLARRITPLDPMDSDRGLIGREPIPGLRKRMRAFIKVQDGCDLSCTYCVTTLARGSSRSIPIKQVIDDIHFAQRGGSKEAVLTGAHLGSWGRDLQPAQTLDELIHAILKNTDIERIRLSSLEPWDLHPNFFSLWENTRMCRHLHLPLQSGSDRILRRMGRRTQTDEYAELLALARSQIPNVAITTDLIAGFPGETDQEFEQSYQFIQKMSFSGGHVFTYSERPGTHAATFPGRVPTKLRKRRGALLRRALAQSSEQFQEGQLGSRRSVLWEAIIGSVPDGFILRGWTDNYIRVQGISQQNRSNEITQVNLRGFTPAHNNLLVDILN